MPTRDEDLELLRKYSRKLGVKLYQIPPWDVHEDEPTPPIRPGSCMGEVMLEDSKKLRRRMLKTAEGRRILAECEAAAARLWP